MRASRLGVEIRFLLREQTAHPRLFQATWKSGLNSKARSKDAIASANLPKLPNANPRSD